MKSAWNLQPKDHQSSSLRSHPVPNYIWSQFTINSVKIIEFFQTDLPEKKHRGR